MQLHERASTVPLNSYDRQDWQKGYESVKQELDYWVDDIEGEHLFGQGRMRKVRCK